LAEIRVHVSAQLEPIKPTPIEYETELKGFGCLRDKITMLAGFNDPIEDFKEYIA
jgi:hypothetical protein